MNTAQNKKKIEYPKVIYLGDHDGETTWCEDRIDDTDVKYVRVTEHPVLKGGDKLYAPLALWDWEQSGIDKVFGGNWIKEEFVHESTNKRSLRIKDGKYGISTGFKYSMIGKQLFLTREEAEQANDDYLDFLACEDPIEDKRRALELKG